MKTTPGIRYGRILIAGFLAEVVILIPVIVGRLLFGMGADTYTLPVACLAFMYVFALWACLGAETQFVLQGALVGQPELSSIWRCLPGTNRNRCSTWSRMR